MLTQQAANRDPRRAISDLTATEFDERGTPLLSSKPGARNVLYLDFNGHKTTSSNAWGAFDAWPFSLADRAGSPQNRSLDFAEQATIENIWRRVTEDFAPFQYDVTTVSNWHWNWC